MRMWLINPRMMCKKHLLGEHVELHMLVGSIMKGRKIDGYIAKGLIETHNIYSRHSEIATEMQRRNYVHLSPLPEFKATVLGKVDKNESIQELRTRCKDCTC